MVKTRKRGCLAQLVRAVVGCAVAAACVVAGTNAVVVLTTRGALVDASQAAAHPGDAIVVLGAGLRPDGTPSDVLRDRVDDGVSLYFAGAAPTIIMSGDSTQLGHDEVGAMVEHALARGVPESAILRDDRGVSTYDSIDRAQRVFGMQRIVIATQTYHQYRALYIAQRLGMDAVGVPSDFHVYKNQPRYSLREIPARTKDFFATLPDSPFEQ